MPINDIRSDLVATQVLGAAISTATTTAGAIIDTKDMDPGLMFVLSAPVYATGDFDLLLEESDDSGMAGATAITGDQLLGALGSITAATTDLPTTGVISVKRYVRASVVSSNTPSATVSVIAVSKPEVRPEV